MIVREAEAAGVGATAAAEAGAAAAAVALPVAGPATESVEEARAAALDYLEQLRDAQREMETVRSDADSLKRKVAEMELTLVEREAVQAPSDEDTEARLAKLVATLPRALEGPVQRDGRVRVRLAFRPAAADPHVEGGELKLVHAFASGEAVVVVQEQERFGAGLGTWKRAGAFRAPDQEAKRLCRGRPSKT